MHFLEKWLKKELARYHELQIVALCVLPLALVF